MYQVLSGNQVMPIERWLGFTQLITEIRAEPKHFTEMKMLRKEWGKAVLMYRITTLNGYHSVN